MPIITLQDAGYETLQNARESFWSEFLHPDHQKIIQAFDSSLLHVMQVIYQNIYDITVPPKQAHAYLMPTYIDYYPMIIRENLFQTSAASFYTDDAPIVTADSSFYIGQEGATAFIIDIPRVLEPHSIEFIADHPLKPSYIFVKDVHFTCIGRHIVFNNAAFANALPRISLISHDNEHITYVILWALRPEIHFPLTAYGKYCTMVANQLNTITPKRPLRTKRAIQSYYAPYVLLTALAESYHAPVLWNETILHIISDATRGVVRIVTSVDTYEVPAGETAHLSLSAGQNITHPLVLSSKIHTASTKSEVISRMTPSVLPFLNIQWVDSAQHVLRSVTLSNASSNWITVPGTASPKRWAVAGSPDDVAAYWDTIATNFTLTLQTLYPSSINPIHALATLHEHDMPIIVAISASPPLQSLSTFVFLRKVLTNQTLLYIHYKITAGQTLTRLENMINNVTIN